MTSEGPTPHAAETAAPAAPAPTGATAVAAAPRRGMRGNAWSMVISTAIVLGLTLLWILLVPRPSQLNQPPVDVSTLAMQTEREMGWEVKVAKDLPRDWTVTNVRLFRTTDGLPTWHVGYRSPAGNYLAIDQTRDATREWTDFQTGHGERDGSDLVAGVPWSRYHAASPLRRSLVRAGSGTELTTVISGNGDYAELATLAHALVDFEPGALSPVPTATAGTAG